MSSSKTPKSVDSDKASRGADTADTASRGADASGNKRSPKRTRKSKSAYARAGVDLDYDESFVDEIKEIARSTLRPEILAGIGGFAGLFKAPERYSNPVFVAAACSSDASTDSVDT